MVGIRLNKDGVNSSADKQPDASIEGVVPMQSSDTETDRPDLRPINKYEALNQMQAQVDAEPDNVQPDSTEISEPEQDAQEITAKPAASEKNKSVKTIAAVQDAGPTAPRSKSAFSRVETNIGIDEDVGDVINSEAMDIDDASKEVIEKIEEVWARLDEDDIELYADSRDAFLTRVVATYGINQAEAEKQLSEIEAACGIDVVDGDA